METKNDQKLIKATIRIFYSNESINDGEKFVFVWILSSSAGGQHNLQ
jgi:hypothetical protein